MFKIRRKSDGLFSTGGDTPSFNKNGKTWNLRGHVTSHLSQLRIKVSTIYSGCEIIEFECVPKLLPVNVIDFYNAAKIRKEALKKEIEIQNKKDRIQHLKLSIAQQERELSVLEISASTLPGEATSL